MRVLVVNAGSSSVKLRVLGDDDQVLGASDLRVERGELDRAALTAASAASDFGWWSGARSERS